jgi:putative nucleotidyltransferase with HDIG domain
LNVRDESTLRAIEAAGLLHDIGKLAVPDHILNKPGKLTPAEFERMKLHAPAGAQILSAIDFPFPVVPIVQHHHEHWNGKGYPLGLAGEEIPLGARILAVVDCFDALTSDRPYRRALSAEEAIEWLKSQRGVMYDPQIVDTFVGVYRELAASVVIPAERSFVLGDIVRSSSLGDDPGNGSMSHDDRSHDVRTLVPPGVADRVADQAVTPVLAIAG